MSGDRQSLDYGSAMHHRVSRWKAQLSLFGGGIAWALHLLLAWAISEFGCIAGWGKWIVGGLSMVAWPIIGATMLTAGMAGVVAFLSARAGQKLKLATGDHAVIAEENKGFIARFSFIMNSIFLFIILVQAIPILFHLREC